MHRRNMLSISAITALGLALMPGSAVSQQKSLKDQLVGAWTLVSTKYKFPDGTTVDTFGPNSGFREDFCNQKPSRANGPGLQPALLFASYCDVNQPVSL